MPPPPLPTKSSPTYPPPPPPPPPDDDRPCLAPMLLRLPRRPSPPALPPRRRKTAVVRLGDRRGWRSGRRLLIGFLRRVRLRWLVAKYRKALKRLRTSYATLMRDLIDGAASMDAVHSRMLTDYYFAAVVVPKPITVGTCPNYYKF